MPTCKLCGEELINYQGQLFIHPDTKCSEKDGWSLNVQDSFLSKNFEIIYGKPSYDPRDYVRLIEVVRRLDKLRFWKFLKKRTKD